MIFVSAVRVCGEIIVKGEGRWGKAGEAGVGSATEWAVWLGCGAVKASSQAPAPPRAGRAWQEPGLARVSRAVVSWGTWLVCVVARGRAAGRVSPATKFQRVKHEKHYIDCVAESAKKNKRLGRPILASVSAAARGFVLSTVVCDPCPERFTL